LAEAPDPMAAQPVKFPIPGPAVIDHIVSLFKQAKKPLITAGTQVYWDQTHEALRQLTHETRIPVFTNGAGRGTLPMTHPHCFKACRSAALREADLVMLIGTPLDFRLKYGQKDWNPEGKLIQVENDSGELNHYRTADVALLADSRQVLETLTRSLSGNRFDNWLDA